MYIDKKQLGGLAALPFGGRLINRKNTLVRKMQRGGEVKTFKNDPEYFNNRTFDDWQVKLLSSGNFGIDPKTDAIIKLKTPVKVPQEWLDVTGKNYEGSETQRRFQTEAGLQQAYQNPVMYAPGSIGLGAGVGAALRAAAPAAMQVLNAPMQVAGRTLSAVTPANLMTAAGVAAAPQNIASGVGNIRQGNYVQGAADIGTAALDLYVPEALNTIKPVGNIAMELIGTTAGKYIQASPYYIKNVASDVKSFVKTPTYKDFKNKLGRLQKIEDILGSTDEGKKAFDEIKSKSFEFWNTPEGERRIKKQLDDLGLSKEGVTIDDFKEAMSEIKYVDKQSQDFLYNRKTNLLKRLYNQDSLDEVFNLRKKKGELEQLISQEMKAWQDSQSSSTPYKQNINVFDAEEEIKSIDERLFDLERERYLLHEAIGDIPAIDPSNAKYMPATKNIYLGKVYSNPTEAFTTASHEWGHGKSGALLYKLYKGNDPKLKSIADYPLFYSETRPLNKRLLENFDKNSISYPSLKYQEHLKYPTPENVSKNFRKLNKPISPEAIDRFFSPDFYTNEAKRYFQTGDEPSAFLNEVLGDLLENNYIKNQSDKIDVDTLKGAIKKYRENTDIKKPVRIFEFINPTEKSLKELADELNDLVYQSDTQQDNQDNTNNQPILYARQGGNVTNTVNELQKIQNNMLKKYQPGGLASFGGGEPNPLFSLSKEDQINYFYELADYVNQYGEDALAQDPMAEEFFYNMLSSKKISNPIQEPDPIKGGDYVEAMITAKRVSVPPVDPIKEFISSPKIQSENFQDFSGTKIPEIVLEDYEATITKPVVSSLTNDNLLSKLGLNLTVASAPIQESSMSMKKIKQAKNGGNVYKKMGLKPMGVFYQGGSVDPAFQRNMPVGNSKSVVGYIPIDGMIPIQTEMDELIVLPTKDVVKVNANKRHSKMSDDEVTDIVPDGSYILSQYGDVDIYKSEADQYIIESKNKPYNLHQQNKPPTVKTLGDFMTKKKMKPADLARVILSKYKITNLDDPFSDNTNKANKFSASRYLDAIIELSELDKRRKGIENNPEAQLYEQDPEMFAINGGRVMKSGFKVQKAQAGAIAGAVTGLLGIGANLYMDAKNRELLKENTAASLRDIDKMANRQTGYENLSLGAALFNPQDPRVELARQKTGWLQGIRNTGMGTQQLDYLMGRNFANMGAARNASVYDPQTANILNEAAYAQALDQGTKAALDFNKMKYDMESKYYAGLGQAMNADAEARAQERMLTTANVNRNLADKVGAFMGSMSNRQNIDSNRAAMEMAARGQQTSGLIQMNNQLAQSLMNSAALGTQAYSSIESARANKKLADAQAAYYNSFTNPQPTPVGQTPFGKATNIVGSLFVPGWPK